MFKPVQIQPPRKPFTIPPIINKSSIPIKEPNMESVEQLFTIVMEGDVNKILSAISDKNMSLNIRNANGQSLIHVVLENNSSGMKEDHKYELIKLLINYGASVSAFDKNNVTALHLASKYQYPKIVKLLLDSSENISSNGNFGMNPLVNVSDNLEMNPLHYAVQGNVETCKKRKKVGSLIPKSVSTIKDFSSTQLKDMTVVIIDILNTENFSRYFQHVKNTFTNIADIFPFDFESKELEFMKSITENIINPKLNNVEKSEFIKKKVIDLTNSFNSMIMEKLKTATNPLNIGPTPENVDGWGPTSTVSLKSFDKILPKGTPSEIKRNIEMNFNAEIEGLFTNYKKEIDNIQIQNSKITKTSNEIYTNIHNIIQLNENAKTNRDVGNDSAKYPSKFEIELKILSALILNKDSNMFVYQEINVIGDVGIDDAFLDKNRINDSPIEVLRGKLSDRREWEKNPKIKPYPLSDDTFIVNGANTGSDKYVGTDAKLDYVEKALVGAFIPSITDGLETIIHDPTNPNARADTRLLQTSGDFDKKPYYYVSKFIFTCNRIKMHVDTLKYNINNLIDHIKTGYYYEIYQTLIANLLLSCYNISQNILLAEKEKHDIIIITNEIKDKFDNTFNRNKNHPYSYLLEYCSIYANEIITHVTNILSDMNSLYDNCTKLIKTFNTTIDLVNKRAGLTYLDKFISSNFTSSTIDQYYEIYDRPLKKLKQPPKNFNEYNTIFGSKDLDGMRKLFYEEYAPYIDIRYYANYIIDKDKNPKIITNYAKSNILKLENFAIPTISTLPRSGYLTTKICTSQDRNTNTYTEVNLPKSVQLKNGGYGLNSNGEPTQPSDINPANAKLLGVDDTGIGKFGVNVPIVVTIDKTNSVVASVGEYLDEHLKTIKFLLVQKVIELFNNKDAQDNGKNIITYDTDKNKNIQKQLENRNDSAKGKYKNSIINNFNITDNLDSILFTTVGKITDDLVILHFKNTIYSNVNRYVKTFMNKAYGIDQNNKTKIIEIINQTPFKVDTGFSLSLNTLFEELIETYYDSSKKNQDYNTLMHTVNVMNEEEPISDQFQIYNTNYRLATDILEKQCYKIEPEIINLLAKAFINVNKKDSTGSTPLIYAIKNLHEKSIKRLLENKANVYISTVTNNSGMTPYKYALSNYKHHIGSLIENKTSVKEIIDRFTQPIYKQIKDNIEATGEFKNNIIRYMDIIFPQLIVMFNNLLYFYAKSYVNDWTFENQKKLEQLLINNNLITNIDDKLPILQDLNKNVVKYSIKFDALNKKSQNQQSEIGKYTDQINKYKKIIENLDKELVELEQKPDKNSFINASINALTNKRNLLVGNIRNINKKIKNQNIDKTKLDTNVQTDENKLFNELNSRVGNFVRTNKYLGSNQIKTPDMYEHIFRHVSDLHADIFAYTVENTKLSKNTKYTGYEDYFLYDKIWKTNLDDNNKMRSIFNIELLSSLLQKSLIDKMEIIKNKQDIDVVSKDLLVLKDLYGKVFVPTINNMFDLPQNYKIEENYVLTEVLDIIKHIIESVLCSNLYYAIIKIITKYVLNVSPDKLINNEAISKVMGTYDPKMGNYNDFIREVTNMIVNPNYKVAGTTSKPKLYEYILKEMPKYLVKLSTKIYSDDLDEEKSITSIDKLFENIMNIILTNEVITIGPNSSLQTNLENYVFKYYKEIFTQIIPKMKIIIDNYSRFILNESRYINMMIMLNDAAKAEMNN